MLRKPWLTVEGIVAPTPKAFKLNPAGFFAHYSPIVSGVESRNSVISTYIAFDIDTNCFDNIRITVGIIGD